MTPQVTSTGTKATRVIGALALVGLGWLLLFGLVLSPPDENQGEAVRMLYLHVPTVWLAYLAFGVTALGSIFYLVPKTRSLAWDRLAGASAEIGVLFTGLTLVAGAIWGRITWGVYWTWDARLTTTALLFVLFLGYLAIRRLPATPAQRAKRCAIAGLIAFIDVPLVHLSVTWWRTLHQPATIKTIGDVEISGSMLFTLFVGLIAFTLVYIWLMIHKMRVMMMEDALDDHGLELALEERRAEAELQEVVP
ncbi:MAG TPA: cytochrome c biogenesis protein CcsA [Acidimicrobiales bacterium]